MLKNQIVILAALGAVLVTGPRADAQKGNDSADWCVVSAGSCSSKETSLSIQQGNSASFDAKLTSPDKLNDAFGGFNVSAYLSAGEWSSDCGLLTCGVNPTVTIVPSTLTFSGFSQAQDFSVQVLAGASVVPGEYRFKVKTFGDDNHHLNAIGWGFGSGIEVTVLVSAVGSCTLPTLTITSPAAGTSLDFCAGSSPTVGSTPVSVGLSATPGITGFSALVSKADDTNQQAVSLTQILSTDPATATGTGYAVGTIGGYKVVATATNACGTDTKTRNFDVKYVFAWLPPAPRTPNQNSTVPTKFSVRDCSGQFIADQTVEVTLTGPSSSVTRTFGTNVNSAVTIDSVNELYHTNLDLPAGQGVSYSIVVKFQGIQQGPTRTFTTK